jgi:hypothetical protein
MQTGIAPDFLTNFITDASSDALIPFRAGAPDVKNRSLIAILSLPENGIPNSG